MKHVQMIKLFYQNKCYVRATFRALFPFYGRHKHPTERTIRSVSAWYFFNMVRAWYMDNLQTPQQLEHHREPPEFISLEVLFERTGVEFFQLNLDTHETDGVLEKIKKTRGYKYEDQITCSKESLPNYEEILKTFFREHLHPEEEIRFILEGSGYFDVRDINDKWIRIEAIPGDMIVVPRGLYHRFTLDANNYIKAKRFFVSGPDWVAFFRPADDMECRKLYLKRLKNGFARKIM